MAFKIELEKTIEDKIVLVDEITLDACRFWSKDILKELDKNRFKISIREVIETYAGIYKRLLKTLN